MGTQPLETDRLLLRRYEMPDAEDMFRNWVTDAEAARFWGWEPHKDIGETKALLSGWISEYERPDVYHWVIVLKSNSQAIGYIYLNEIDGVEESVSVHFLLGRKYWNQGIMTEASARVITFAFSVLGVKKVCSRHHIDNPASGRVQQKCGMRHVKTEQRDVPDCERISGKYLYYEITEARCSQSK
ncbi:MAG: GNAT family N-acetyltransferase [Defluviitaleaceae bacterium]|nr:GNAT family N-acetyltransferase [Defluviitaleaceae bacterium]